MPLFKDPATIKFVAKKFILSTNDPDNPITTIGATLGNKSGLGQVNYDGTDNLATGLKDIVNLVMKEIKVTVRDECEA